MKVQSLFVALVMIMTVTAAMEGQSREALLETITAAPGWSAVPGLRLYAAADIASLNPRRAAAIRSFGVTGAASQVFQGVPGRVSLTLYQMLDSSAAYGLFALERRHDRQDFEVLPIGQEAFRTGASLFVWQSRFVLKLDGNAVATEALARLLSQQIVGSSLRPAVSKLLPSENRIAGSEKYFVDPDSFRRELGLDASRFGFEDSVEVATARYRIGEASMELILFLYPTQQIAKRYTDTWETTPDPVVPFRKRVGPLAALVRNTKDNAISQQLLDLVNYESQVTWNEPEPGLTLRHMVLTIFSFIGVALLFTFFAGVGFGGVRIWVKARYPDRVFDRSRDMEIIQLKLGQGVSRRHLSD